MHAMCMQCVWSMHGLCMEYVYFSWPLSYRIHTAQDAQNLPKIGPGPPNRQNWAPDYAECTRWVRGLDSLESLPPTLCPMTWLIYGICMGYVLNMHGLCTEYVWNMHGICMAYAWNVHEICMCMDHARTMRQICMGYALMECAWTTYGICMVHECSMHGLCMAYAWNMHGVRMSYTWTMHGICSE